jgi:hypothetical protein
MAEDAWPSRDLREHLEAVGEVLLAAERGDLASRSMDYGRGVAAVAGRLRAAMGEYAPPPEVEPLDEEDLEVESSPVGFNQVCVRVVHKPTGLGEVEVGNKRVPALAEALDRLTRRVRLTER